MHLMFHGGGGFIGGLIGVLFLRPVNEPCGNPPLFADTCRDLLGISAGFVDPAGWELKVTILALAGIGIGELLKRSSG